MADLNYSAAGGSEIALKGAKDNQKRKEASLQRGGLSGSHLQLMLYVRGMIHFNLVRKE